MALTDLAPATTATRDLPAPAADRADARRPAELPRADTRRVRTGLGSRTRRISLALVVPTLLLVAWHLATAVTGVFASYELPAPASVWQAGVELVERG